MTKLPVGALVAPVTPDIGMADNGVIAVSVTAVIAGPITIAVSRVAVAITGIPIGVGVTSDTAQFAVASIRRWLDAMAYLRQLHTKGWCNGDHYSQTPDRAVCNDGMRV
jgi:hypothetical protein